MQSDSATRVLLALILLCLVILIFQGRGDDDPFDAGWGRYQVTGMRAGAPVLIRTDTVTGQVWKLELRGGGNQWVAFTEPESSDAGGNPEQASRESRDEPVETARAERDVIEPPGAPPLPSEPPRASREVLDALPPPEPAAAPSGDAPSTAEPPDVQRFAEALRNEELPADMRAWVAKQLAGIDDPRATEALLGALGDAEPEVVEASLRALSGRDDERIRAAAEEASASGAEDVQRAAEDLLESVE